jgi:hypothetical protein
MSGTIKEPLGGPESSESRSYSGRTPEEIEGEIEATRQKLTDTLEALQSKLSPRQRMQAATESARNLKGRLMRSASVSMSPGITTMIRMDHTHVLALFRRFHGSTPAGRKRALVTNACLALEIHTRLEEEIFYPAMREAIGQSDVLDKSVPEHNEIRSLITAVRAMQPGDPAYDDTFRMLMRTVLHHVADEESILLARAEEVMPDRLSELGKQMTKRRVELLRPHLGEVASTTARSFPMATAAAAASVLALGWLVFRPRHPTKH